MLVRPAQAFPPADFWRSLHYFNLYRLILASVFLFLVSRVGTALTPVMRNEPLFFYTGVAYMAVVLLSFVSIHYRWPRFNWQLTWQVSGDIAALTLLSYASGELQSNLGLLLLISMAAAGLISRGTITLFFASLASITALLEHTYEVLFADADAAKFVQVGLLSMSYFAVAWLAHTLAKYAVDSQQLAQRRGRALVSMAEANRLVMRDMQDGVLVVDGQGVMMQMNLGAERMLRKTIDAESLLSDAFPILYVQYALWKHSGEVSREILQLDAGLQARLRFVAIERNAAHGVVIFLEDMQRVRAEAQQIKLAALGRLTANIAHEIRNPLSAISYAAELLRENASEGLQKAKTRAIGSVLTAVGQDSPELPKVEQGRSDDASQMQLLNILLDNTQRINKIVQDVMQLNRRDRAHAEVFDVAPLLRTLIQEIELAENIKPGVIVLAGLPKVEVRFDAGHLRQILWDLCLNALRYCRKQPGSLVLTVGMDEGSVWLEVQDDGVGISAEHQGQLFEPFFTTATNGTGLGLYIARELCEANGAQLDYHEAEVGARFRITCGEM